MKNYFASTLIICLFGSLQPANAGDKPNIILIIADDAGYSDFGFQGCKDLKTPHLDRLASNGVRFTQGYVTASCCGPSRAGLMTGKYQQRYGYEENNMPGCMSPTTCIDDNDMGIPLSQLTMGNYMKSLGYKTSFFGKWHLGGSDKLHPTNRGFDKFYGFRGGARSYFAYSTIPKNRPLNALERGLNSFEEHDAYLTDRLGEETVAFIEKSKNQPFFTILSFNAVHAPMQASKDDLSQFPELNGKRKILAAMTLAMDRACGDVMNKLSELNLDNNTMVVFISDNGGPSIVNASVNLPLAGGKANNLEGGIRVPFVITWPDKFPGNKVYSHPVSTMDLLPTFFQAAGGNSDTLSNMDGVNLIPFINGENNNRPHQELFWKEEINAAVRDGDWKLIRYPDRPAELFNLAEDISEQNDLTHENPEKVRALYKKLFDWEMTLERPAWQLLRHYEIKDMESMDKYRIVK